MEEQAYYTAELEVLNKRGVVVGTAMYEEDAECLCAELNRLADSRDRLNAALVAAGVAPTIVDAIERGEQ